MSLYDELQSVQIKWREILVTYLKAVTVQLDPKHNQLENLSLCTDLKGHDTCVFLCCCCCC